MFSLAKFIASIHSEKFTLPAKQPSQQTGMGLSQANREKLAAAPSGYTKTQQNVMRIINE
jgi:hypothetical protein